MLAASLREYAGLWVLAAALVVGFGRVLVGDVFYWGLPALQFVPWRTAALELLASGQLPLWHMWNGAGVPLFANYQSALLYPLGWPAFVLSPAWALSLIAVLHLFIGGAGLFAFVRALGLPAFAAGVGALAFGLTAYLVGRLGTYPIGSAAAWLPWGLWAITRASQNTGRMLTGTLALAAFTALLLTAGHAQTAWYTLLVWGIWALFAAVHGRRLPMLFALAAAVVLGVLIAAVQLWATAEFLSVSPRETGVAYDRAMNFSYHPLRLITLIVPNLFGTPGDGSYLTQGAYFEDAAYIGLLPFGAAVYAVWRRVRGAGGALRGADRALRGADRALRAAAPLAWAAVPLWAGMAVVAVVFAFGRHTPVFPWLYEHVPTFSLFQAPVRWHLWTVTALSVLAAVGAAAWCEGPPSRAARRWAGRVLAGALAIGLLTAGVWAARPGLSEAVVVLAFGVAHTAAAAAAWALLVRTRPQPGAPRVGRWAGAVLVVIAADLLWATRGLNPTAPAALLEPVRPQPGAEAAPRLFWPEAAETEAAYTVLFRFDDYRPDARLDGLRTRALANLNILDRRPVFNHFDPLTTAAFARYRAALDATGAPGLLAAAGIGAVVRDADGAHDPISAEPLPAAWAVSTLCAHADEAALWAALTDRRWQPQRTAHILGEGGCTTVPAAAATRIAPASIAPASVAPASIASGSRRALDQAYTVRFAQPGWLITHDSAYPGWEAAIDGRPAPVLTVNGMFRGVHVHEPGEHTITWHYRPGWLGAGALISGAALGIWAALAGAALITARRKQTR